MADRYLLETSSVDGYLLEDGTGVLSEEGSPYVERPKVVTGPFPFPKTSPSFIPSIITETIVALSGIAATLAAGVIGLTVDTGMTGVSGTPGISLGSAGDTVSAVGVGATGATGIVVPGFTLAPTGIPATGGAGTVTSPGWSEVLSGVAATGGRGTLTPTFPTALSGLAATGSPGTESPSFDVSLTGVVGTSGLGSISAGSAGTASLTGVVGTGSVGTLGSADGEALSGVEATGSPGTLTDSASPALSGVQATGSPGSLYAVSNAVDRPRLVRGPFPFPKEKPAFFVPTVVAPLLFPLAGNEATSDVGNITGVDFVVALSGVQGSGGTGTILSQTPGIGVLVGVQGATGIGSLAPSNTEALVGQEAAAAKGLVTPSVQTFDRPHSITGPFPFLTGGMFQFRQRTVLVNPLSQSITIGLTGVQAAGQRGTIAVGSDVVALTGVQSTSATGIPIPGESFALTGLSATSAAGTLGIGSSINGQQATGQVGSESPSISVGLTGLVATGSINSLAAQANADVTLGLTGVATVTSIGTLSPVRALAITNIVGTGAPGSTAAAFILQPSGRQAALVLGSLSPSGNSVISLAGSVATGQIGSPAAAGGPIPVGQEAATDVGVISPASSVALGGVASTTATGTVTIGRPVILTLIGRVDNVITLKGTNG